MGFEGRKALNARQAQTCWLCSGHRPSRVDLEMGAQMSNIMLSGRLQAVKESHASSVDGFEDQLKLIAATALGLIPGGGSVLGMLLGLYWPSSGFNLEAFFERVKEWVRHYVEWRLAQEQLQRANDLMKGYKRNVEDANRLQGRAKLDMMISLHADINTHADFFLTESDFQKMYVLATFSPMAVLHVSLLSEIVKLARELGDSNAGNWYDILEDRSRQYALGGRKAVDHVVPWRRNQIDVNISFKRGGYPPHTQIHLLWRDRFLNVTYHNGVIPNALRYYDALTSANAVRDSCRAHFNKYVVEVVGQWDGKGRGVQPGEDVTPDANAAQNEQVLRALQASAQVQGLDEGDGNTAKIPEALSGALQRQEAQPNGGQGDIPSTVLHAPLASR